MHDVLQSLPADNQTAAAPGPFPTAVVAASVVAGAAAVAVAVVAHDARFAAVVAAIAFAVGAAIVDFRTGRIPDRLVAAALLPLIVVPLIDADGDLAWSMLVGAALFAGPLFVAHVVSPSAMGFGDVKLGVPLGAAAGVFDARLALLGLCLASAGAAAYGLALRRPAVRFGPALVLGVMSAGTVAAVGGVPWR